MVRQYTDLVLLAQNFQVTGPDADGLVWLAMNVNGKTARAMFNLGPADSFVAKMALRFEEDRRDALRAAGVEP